MEFKTHKRFLRHIASMPFIYGMVIPILILDVFIEVYHRVCFPLYGIPYIIRKDYIVFDRHKLPYLSLVEKMNCAYCSYANGFFAYCVAIAGATEKYWCGIKHKKTEGFHEPDHHKDFMEYGDADAYCKLVKK